MPSILGSVVNGGGSLNTTSILEVDHTLLAGNNRQILVYAWLWYSDHNNPRAIDYARYDEGVTDIPMLGVVSVSHPRISYGALYTKIWRIDEDDIPATPGVYKVRIHTTAPQDYRTMFMTAFTLQDAIQGPAEKTGNDTGNNESTVSTLLDPVSIGAFLATAASSDEAQDLTPGSGQTPIHTRNGSTFSIGGSWEIAESISENQSYSIPGTEDLSLVSASFKDTLLGNIPIMFFA